MVRLLRAGAGHDMTSKQRPRFDPVSRGRKNKAAGQAFEDWIEAQNAVLSQRGLAYVFKVPTDRGHDGRPRRKTWVDFSGMVAGGRSIALEAKSCTSAVSFLFSKLKPHQRAVLARTRELGGIAGVLICRENPGLETVARADMDALRARFGTRRAYYYLPYAEVERILAEGKRAYWPFPKAVTYGPETTNRIHTGELWISALERCEPNYERILCRDEL